MAWGLPSAAREMGAWRLRAQTAPDAPIREDALNVFARKRTHVDGAGLFWVVLRRRVPHLLRLLVAYQSLIDFLDYASERGAHAGQRNGEQLHIALCDAVDASSPPADCYEHHPWRQDAGYMRALVLSCRLRTSELPSYPLVRSLAISEAKRGPEVLAANHSPEPSARDAGLRRWAERHFPAERRLSWFEISASTSGALANHALLTLAAERDASASSVAETYEAYLPWVALSTAMLDSYADLSEDEETGGHSYIAHYDSLEAAERRLEEIVSTTLAAVLRLRHGHRHAVIVSCMVAMYLTKDSVREPHRSRATRAIAAAGGPLTVRLLPVLRAWRLLNSHSGS